MVNLRFVYGLFTDYCEQFKDGYVGLRVVYDFIRVILRIDTGYYEHFKCSYEYFTNRYV